MRTIRASLLAGALLVAGAVAEAASQGGGPPPDLELLEFLGGWQTEDGKTVDPFVLDEMPIPDEGEAARGVRKERGRQAPAPRSSPRSSPGPADSAEDRDLRPRMKDNLDAK